MTEYHGFTILESRLIYIFFSKNLHAYHAGQHYAADFMPGGAAGVKATSSL